MEVVAVSRMSAADVQPIVNSACFKDTMTTFFGSPGAGDACHSRNMVALLSQMYVVVILRNNRGLKRNEKTKFFFVFFFCMQVCHWWTGHMGHCSPRFA
jgi:hypothetical protein